MITVNDVRDGVIAALKAAYPERKVYDEEIKQGFSSPCFFVKILTAGQNREVGRRYKREHSLDVHGYADTNDELRVVVENLFTTLEYVSVPGGSVRGIRMNHEIVDGVLHFFVDYDFRVVRENTPEVKMQTLAQEANFKDG